MVFTLAHRFNPASTRSFVHFALKSSSIDFIMCLDLANEYKLV